jgi:hypothetical protein
VMGPVSRVSDPDADHTKVVAPPVAPAA